MIESIRLPDDDSDAIDSEMPATQPADGTATPEQETPSQEKTDETETPGSSP
jgi:hypothetical protein